MNVCRSAVAGPFLAACAGAPAPAPPAPPDPEWRWIRKVCAVATPEDIDLLLKVRAKVWERRSDEALYEVRALEEVLKHVGRSRYRAETRVCAEVKPK